MSNDIADRLTRRAQLYRLAMDLRDSCDPGAHELARQVEEFADLKYPEVEQEEVAA